MQEILENTPIIIGVGQISESVPEDLNSASSHIDLAVKACDLAIRDSGLKGQEDEIDTFVGVRTFADSDPTRPSPFGNYNNFPRSVANRVDCDPKEAIYSAIGGDSGQRLVNEFANHLFEGTTGIVVITGAEVVANIKAAKKAGVELDWSENIEGQLSDRGRSKSKLISTTGLLHQVVLPMQYYALMENARQHTLGIDREEYRRKMGESFSELSKIASQNPLATDQNYYAPEDISTVSKANPNIIFPYTKRMISKDRVNLASAIIMTTVGKARSLGIDESKWVYLHNGLDLGDYLLLERSQLGHSQIMPMAFDHLFTGLDISLAELNHYDIYSCFPIVVEEAKTYLKLKSDQQISLTGGMPFFGGPGNNYASHGIISMVETLRKNRGEFGMVMANGGWISNISLGLYSTKPVSHWKAIDSGQIQEEFELSNSKMNISLEPNGEAVLKSYAVHYFKGFPIKAIIIGELKDSQERFYASCPMEDTETVQLLLKEDPIGKTIFVWDNPKSNQFAFSEAHLERFKPKIIDQFKDNYNFCKVERDKWILKVTINRPELGNALHPPANDELEGVFNAFEKDPDLRVAILTGSGLDFFSSGNDLKYMAQGNPMWVPKTGFGGLSFRKKRTKPIIAAINGACYAGGFEMALACDILLASEKAKFALSEVKVGLIAATGGIQRLMRKISPAVAKEMLVTGKAIDAKRAYEIGLINYITSSDDLLKQAESIAQEICMASPVAVKCTMKAINDSNPHADIDVAVRSTDHILDDLINSDDFWEGAKAFSEKRPPNWTKRND